jgi:hypothetical protein
MEKLQRVIDYVREDAHSRFGIPLMLIGWLTVAGVVIALGNFNPTYWHDGWNRAEQNFINNYTMDRSQ